METIDFKGHNNPVYAVEMHPTKNICYTAGSDYGIVEWGLEQKQFLRIFKPVKHTVYALKSIVLLNKLVAGCNNGDILFFDIESGLLDFKLNVKSAVFCIKYVTSKNELLVSTDAGEIIIVSISQQKIIHRFSSGTQKVRNFDFNESINVLATASNDKQVRFYQLDDFTFINSIEAHAMGVSSIAFSANGQEMLTGSRNAEIKVWDAQNWDCKKTIVAHLFAIYQISFHPHLPYYATCSRDKSIKVWRSNDYSLFKNLSIDKNENGHRLSVNQICWIENVQSLLSVSDDKLLKMWILNN